MQPLQICIVPIIRIGQESWCLPYAGFLLKLRFLCNNLLKNFFCFLFILCDLIKCFPLILCLLICYFRCYTSSSNILILSSLVLHFRSNSFTCFCTQTLLSIRWIQRQSDSNFKNFTRENFVYNFGYSYKPWICMHTVLYINLSHALFHNVP